WYLHARAAVDQALAMDASDYGALRAKAWVLLGMHEFADARAAAEQALTREPDDFMNWANLTDALVELGDYGRAVDAADRLARLHPGVVAYTRVAGLQALLGNRGDAIATLEQAGSAADQGTSEGLAGGAGVDAGARRTRARRARRSGGGEPRLRARPRRLPGLPSRPRRARACAGGGGSPGGGDRAHRAIGRARAHARHLRRAGRS